VTMALKNYVLGVSRSPGSLILLVPVAPAEVLAWCCECIMALKKNNVPLWESPFNREISTLCPGVVLC
jgi:hypothetical protein